MITSKTLRMLADSNYKSLTPEKKKEALNSFTQQLKSIDSSKQEQHLLETLFLIGREDPEVLDDIKKNLSSLSETSKKQSLDQLNVLENSLKISQDWLKKGTMRDKLMENRIRHIISALNKGNT